MKPGTILMCVDNQETYPLTIGGIYVVQALDPDVVIVITDEGERRKYFYERFVILLEP